MGGDRGGYPGLLDPIGGRSNILSLNPDRKREFRDIEWIRWIRFVSENMIKDAKNICRIGGWPEGRFYL